MPIPELGQAEWPTGSVSFDRTLAAHFQDAHERPLFRPAMVISATGADVSGADIFSMRDRVRVMDHVIQEHVDLADLIANHVISGHFPLHTTELGRLAARWARVRLSYTWAPP